MCVKNFFQVEYTKYTPPIFLKKCFYVQNTNLIFYDTSRTITFFFYAYLCILLLQRVLKNMKNTCRYIYFCDFLHHTPQKFSSHTHTPLSLFCFLSLFSSYDSIDAAALLSPNSAINSAMTSSMTASLSSCIPFSLNHLSASNALIAPLPALVTACL